MDYYNCKNIEEEVIANLFINPEYLKIIDLTSDDFEDIHGHYH